jgi:succinate dehydrogenase / fumarate reductase, iron-sulfur subunit
MSFRRSCREGVCGSDAMNINGKNGLACLTNMLTLKGTIVLKPLPGLPVIRDLIVDMTQFFKQYNSIKPYLQSTTTCRPKRNVCKALKSAKSSTASMNASCARAARRAARASGGIPDKFVGPAGLLQAYRFIADSRDEATAERSRQSGRPVPPVPLPHDHELRRRVP